MLALAGPGYEVRSAGGQVSPRPRPQLRWVGTWRLPPEFSRATVTAFATPGGAIVWRWPSPPSALDRAAFEAVHGDLEAEALARALA